MFSFFFYILDFDAYIFVVVNGGLSGLLLVVFCMSQYLAVGEYSHLVVIEVLLPHS